MSTTLPININQTDTRRHKRLQKQLTTTLFQGNIMDVVVKYALVWAVLLTIVAGCAKTFASRNNLDSYNIDVPHRIL